MIIIGLLLFICISGLSLLLNHDYYWIIIVHMEFWIMHMCVCVCVCGLVCMQECVYLCICMHSSWPPQMYLYAAVDYVHICVYMYVYVF
jgi:hypothetical protein